MKIIQKINNNDLVNFNFYLLEKNLSFKLSTIVLGVLSLILGSASIVYELILTGKVLPLTIVIGTILVILGIFALFFLKPILKLSLKKKILKRKEQIDDIAVSLEDAGILWVYANEDKNKTEATPFTWTSILKAVEKQNYIYIHANQYIILFIKKEDCPSYDEIKEILKNKLTTRYVVKVK